MVGYLIKLNTVDITPYLAQGGYKVSLPKLWTDAGRNMQGDLRTTFLGIFPKISLKFKPTSVAELKTIVEILNDSTISVEWWNPITGTYKTGNFYAGDFDFSLLLKDKDVYESFEVNIISFNKMT